MASKARALKTPIQLWVADERKRLGMKPADIARLTGVTEATARGWESQGRPGQDAIAILERTFGSSAPDNERGEAPSDLASAIRDQTRAINELVDALRPMAGPLAQQVADLQWAVQRLYEQAGLGSPKPSARNRIEE